MPPHSVPRLREDLLQQRVSRTLQKELKADPRHLFVEFQTLNSFFTDFDWSKTQTRSVLGLGDAAADAVLRSFADELGQRLSSSSQPLERLDQQLQRCFKCKFELPTRQDDILREATRLLERLPQHTVALPPGLLKSLKLRAPVRSFKSEFDDATIFWEQSGISGFLDTNTIRVALCVAGQKCRPKDNSYSSFERPFATHLNNMITILDEAQRLLARSAGQNLESSFAEVISFVWTSWQRCLTLVLTDRVAERMAFGYTGWEPVLRSPRFLDELSRPFNSSELPPYMCRWSFGLLQNNRRTLGRDSRTIQTRFREFCQEYGHITPRCINNDDGTFQPCSGNTPEECRRFIGMKVKDQSMHAYDCSNHQQCINERMFWDENSYRQVDGGRAVSIQTRSQGNKLQYCTASDRTLTVSHVWSHGQGGRPEFMGTGFNRCLHQRYCRIALENGCDSYWIDTACIPNDHGLRQEAIDEINNIFFTSNMTLLCDKDIMDVDISCPTIEVKERLLAILLVCDWNIRAWTFLEAMRSRSHLYLLCRDEQTMSLKELLASALDEGSLDLISAFAECHHLIPMRSEDSVRQLIAYGSKGNPGRHASLLTAQGLVGTAEAACLLSRRYATRSNDEVVIWSLLCGGNPQRDAEAFWNGHRVKTSHAEKLLDGGFVQTAFLVSSAPRVQTPGLRWAPARPNPELQKQLDGSISAFYPKDSIDAAQGRITADGLEAEWLFAGFDVEATTAGESWWNFTFNQRYSERRGWETVIQMVDNFLHSYRFGAFLRVASRSGAPYDFKGQHGGQLTVVVGSQVEVSETWTWLGVVEWPLYIGEPVFRLRNISLD